MPRFYSIIVVLLLTISGWGQSKDSAWIVLDGLPVKVNSVNYNFGNLEQFENAKFEFQLINLDAEVLVIKHVTTSCNCTSPSFTKKPTKQGKKASVKIKFDASSIGAFNKSVFVYTNKQEKPIKLSISGMVKKATRPEDKSTKGVSKITPKMENKVPNSNN